MSILHKGSRGQDQTTGALGSFFFLKTWNLFSIVFCWTMSSLVHQHWPSFLDWYYLGPCIACRLDMSSNCIVLCSWCTLWFAVFLVYVLPQPIDTEKHVLGKGYKKICLSLYVSFILLVWLLLHTALLSPTIFAHSLSCPLTRWDKQCLKKGSWLMHTCVPING